VRRLLAFLVLPHHAGLALQATGRTTSAIWYAAGDESADFSFYTKRGLLAPVLVSTTLYWLSDEGDGAGDYPETWKFLDRRIGDVLKILPLKARLFIGARSAWRGLWKPGSNFYRS
jgi:ubiquinone biosynthesis protein COQ9